MIPIASRAGKGEKATRSRAVRPQLEGLEDRLLLYSYTGDHFAYGDRITWSIVPDGTNLGGVNSNLISTLNAKFGAGNWEQAVDDAFAQWENVSNVDLVQVGDNGAPTGSGNLQQGSDNFGDIRIGGYFQASNIMAYTLLPPAANGGSDSGDIFLNTSQNWNIGSGYDLETVLVHEIGHAVAGLGDETSNPNAVEYTYYNGVKQIPSNDDIAGAQYVWGPRAEDGIAQGCSNFTSNKAATITQFTNGGNDQIVLPNQDVAVSGQLYWFKFTTPANASNNLTVQIQSQYLSELSPMVQLYNGYGQGLVQTAAATNTYGATIDASISNATPNTTYYVRVSGSSTLASGTGAYAMTVNMGYNGISLVAPPIPQVAVQPDQGAGGAYQLVGSTLPTLADLQAHGDFFNFAPINISSGWGSGIGSGTIFSLQTGGFNNAPLFASVQTSNSSNNPGANLISEIENIVSSLPAILIGMNTPNYNGGLLNFGW
jgi:hypothetical protein